MTDITAIKRMLADRAQSVAEFLLPGGKREGQEWRAGSVGGEPGQSLGVHLSGDKSGLWRDFATDEGGDLLDLWRAARGQSLPEALDAARAWLGVERPEPYRRPDRSYTRPPKPQCNRPAGRVKDYLTEERGIPGAVLDAYRIGEDGDRIVFPFLLPDGTLALAKSRAAEDGASPRPTSANCEPVLFGWQALPEDAREVIITEGEIDALSWAAYGFPAMSVPFGGGKGGKQNWIESDFERMERFERIYLSLDMDQPGEEAAEEIASRLGRHRCLRVELPHKDANECLMQGVTREDMAVAVAGARHLDPEGLRRPSEYLDSVARIFWPEPGERQGYSTPFGKLGAKIAFRPGELTLWTGASGAGKSQVLSHCIVHWIEEGGRVCLSSLEMKPEQTLRRMTKQAGGVDRPTRPYLEQVLRWLDQGLLIYDRVGKSGVEGLLDVFDYARAKYGCDQFVIDSLLRLGIAGDDYTGQEKATFRLVDWSIQNGVHVHLVAHARKGERDQGPAGIEDVKGAMEIGANAANIIAIWRNRKHEQQLKDADSEEERMKLDEKPGVVLNIPKQRSGDYEGRIGLWFDQSTYRYHSSYDRSIWRHNYIDAPHAELGAA